MELLDDRTLLVHRWLPGRNPRYGTYRVPVDSIGNARAYSLLTSTGHLERTMNISGVVVVRGLIGQEQLLMSGDTERGGRGVGLYSMKNRELMWLTPPEQVHEHVGWTRGRRAVLLSHTESLHTGQFPVLTSLTPTLLELDIASGMTRAVFRSPEFRFSVDDSDASCGPFRNASGSPGGEHVVVIGRKVGGPCKPYLIRDAGSPGEQVRELTVADSMGPAIWYPDGQRFLMLCGASTVCRYTGEGMLTGQYRFPRKGFYLADYHPPTDTVLLRHDVSPFDTSIGAAAIATYFFEDRVKTPSWRFRLRSWWYSRLYQ
jgi:hypothetical protein